MKIRLPFGRLALGWPLLASLAHQPLPIRSGFHSRQIKIKIFSK
jgi:hypothetical protein